MLPRSRYLLDLLAQVPDPRKKRGRRYSLAGLLAVGIAAVVAVRGVVRRDRAVVSPTPARRCWPSWARPAARRRSARSPWSASMYSSASSALAAHQGRAGRRPTGDRHRRQDRPRLAAHAKLLEAT